MDSIDNSQLIEDFITDCRIRRMSNHSIEGYKSSLNLLSKYMKKTQYNFVNADKELFTGYIDYLNRQGISYSTLKNRFSTYCSFYDYLKYKGHVKEKVVKDVSKRYLTKYKDCNSEKRKIISVEEMARFINMIPDVRDKAIALLFAKTGIRRRELVRIDLDDIDWEKMSITLKPTNKRSNRVVYFDYETASILKRWINKRETYASKGNRALFVSYINRKKRLNRNGVAYVFVKWAEMAGLHDVSSEKLGDKFTPHCCRHWFTTHLSSGGNGMPREFIKELRGDVNKEAMDIYNHIDHEDLRKSYLVHIPKLGII